MNSAVVVTLNKNGVASYSELSVAYREAGPAPSGGVRPPSWASNRDNPAPQLFSDRTSAPASGVMRQPFDITQSDTLGLTISVESSPNVSIVLRSWGDVRATFRGTCSAGGVIHGSTPDVDYLIYIVQAAGPL
ncbi:MAG TPA: hypothetical protein VFV65_05215 [Gemmatimonadales bacterium]|nr:hypothetical protein [Gemmatimonadales bacterium]